MMNSRLSLRKTCKNCGADVEGMSCPVCHSVGSWYPAELILILVIVVVVLLVFMTGIGTGYYIGFSHGANLTETEAVPPVDFYSAPDIFEDANRLLSHWIILLITLLAGLLLLNLHEATRTYTSGRRLVQLRGNRIVLVFLIAVLLPVLFAAIMSGINWLIAFMLIVASGLRWVLDHRIWIVTLTIGILFLFTWRYTAAWRIRIWQWFFKESENEVRLPEVTDPALLLKPEFEEFLHIKGGDLFEAVQTTRIWQRLKVAMQSRGSRTVIAGPDQFGGTAASKLAHKKMIRKNDNMCLFYFCLQERHPPDPAKASYRVEFSEVRNGTATHRLPKVMGHLVINYMSHETHTEFHEVGVPNRLKPNFPRTWTGRNTPLNMDAFVKGLDDFQRTLASPNWLFSLSRFKTLHRYGKLVQSTVTILIDRVVDIRVLNAMHAAGLFTNETVSVVVLARSNDLQKRPGFQSTLHDLKFEFEDIALLVDGGEKNIRQILNALCEPAGINVNDAHSQECISILCKHLEFAGKGAGIIYQLKKLHLWKNDGERNCIYLHEIQQDRMIQRNYRLQQILDMYWNEILPDSNDLQLRKGIYNFMHHIFPDRQFDYGSRRFNQNDLRRKAVESFISEDKETSLRVSWNLIEVLKACGLLEETENGVKTTWTPHKGNDIPTLESIADPPDHWLDDSDIRTDPDKSVVLFPDPERRNDQEDISPDRLDSVSLMLPWETFTSTIKELMLSTLQRSATLATVLIDGIYLVGWLSLVNLFTSYIIPSLQGISILDQWMFNFMQIVFNVGTSAAVLSFIIQDLLVIVGRIYRLGNETFAAPHGPIEK